MMIMKIKHGMEYFLLILFAFLLVAAPAFSEEIDCLSCHESLAAGKSVHQAISLGCTVCHTGINAADIPHRITSRFPKGLSSRQRTLCYGCHEKSQFMKNTVHGALFLGCTSCHSPHSSENDRLLKEAVPGLCMRCHEETVVTGKNTTHESMDGVSCSSCHNPHATDSPMLLISRALPAKGIFTAME